MVSHRLGGLLLTDLSGRGETLSPNLRENFELQEMLAFQARVLSSFSKLGSNAQEFLLFFCFFFFTCGILLCMAHDCNLSARCWKWEVQASKTSLGNKTKFKSSPG